MSLVEKNTHNELCLKDYRHSVILSLTISNTLHSQKCHTDFISYNTYHNTSHIRGSIKCLLSEKAKRKENLFLEILY